MAFRWYDAATVPGGPPRRVVLPPGSCRRLQLQPAPGVAGVLWGWVQRGQDPTTVQELTGAALQTAAAGWLLVPDDAGAVDLSHQGPAGTSVCFVLDDGCGCR